MLVNHGTQNKKASFFSKSQDVLVIIGQKYKMISKEHEAKITNKAQYNQEITEKQQLTSLK